MTASRVEFTKPGTGKILREGFDLRKDLFPAFLHSAVESCVRVRGDKRERGGGRRNGAPPPKYQQPPRYNSHIANRLANKSEDNSKK